MFDGFMKSKFYTKCKSGIKLTRTRIEIIKRKRSAVEKYLKKDIIDLLKTGLDSNAYGRAEGFLVERNLSSCYDFVDQCCVSVLSHLSIMNKQRECPEECRESVPSLMFAAARFSDLPELRELRSLFAERYENSLDRYVNQEFVKKLKSMLPTKEMKLQLIQDVALESGIEWDSKALGQKLYNPPPSEQNLGKNIKNDNRKMPKINKESEDRKSDDKVNEYTQSRVTDSKVKERKQEDLLGRGRKDVTTNGHQVENKDDNRKMPKINKGSEDKGNEYMQSRVTDSKVKERNQEDLSGRGRKDITNNGHKLENKRENVVPEENSKSNLSFETRKNTPIQGIHLQQRNPKSAKSASEDEIDEKKQVNYRVLPPPPYKIKPKLSTNESNLVDPLTSTKLEFEIGEAKPLPRSVRRTRLKPPPGHENVEIAKQALRILNDDHRDKKDGEEKVMDRLLLHYSAKQSPSEHVKVESSLKPTPPLQQRDGGKPIPYRGKGVIQTRQTSLPPEPTSPIESTKGHARSSSFQPEILNHVHPNLPDYDDFVARLAAFRSK